VAAKIRSSSVLTQFSLLIATLCTVKRDEDSWGNLGLVQESRKRKRFHMDLTELHALCEANYVRLLSLFPDYQQANERRFKLGSRLIVMTVIERDRHTTTLSVNYHAADLPQLMHSNLHLRMYHDVAMAEVVKLRSGRRLESRYDYPNSDMHQPDEKRQQNSFVSELLSLCLSDAHIDETVFEAGDV
jgi:uncharacterized protein YqiB (DUF1249 family)